MKTRTLASITLICLFVTFTAATTLADTIRLKNGTVIKGKVTSFANGSFTVVLELGSSSKSRAIIDMRDVETIEFEGRGEDGEGSTAPSSTREQPRPVEPENDTGRRPATVSKLPSEQPSANPVAPSGRANSANRPAPAGSGTSTNPATSASHATSTGGKETIVAVGAKDDWTYANLAVHRGDRIQVSATGKVKISPTQETGPEGINLEDKNKLLLDRPTGALIAVIGDDNDDFIYIGRDSEFVAARDGKLFLSVNEGDLSDNEGSFSVRIRVEPAR